ncbi:MAG: pyroglutamyl-peptidase I [Candidatus Wallbacteria bacterium HGW-Wallbacteria-1]|jgi:pyroglutamyl-peptidase|uniref:Pyrrolidone-carboxylate peptidase n=1 Tax=Candidatus Wallbacteria bacterium HGW-Wallbacteria-1 TaxID=2013854 RepID=A0A2N1PS02_9BACT|nr:MAG: pyroglutamyl-peptidase I [Candidatus Wallbacteria bacterium HGW-Wallbacteria-1]
MSEKLILTGFTPFENTPHNPSGEIVPDLVNRLKQKGVNCSGLILETAYSAVENGIDQVISSEKPSAIISFGVASAIRCLELERFALNIDDASIADNYGEIRSAVTIDPAGPHAHRCRAEVKKISETLEKMGIPVRISNHCGTFVCNHLYYWIMNRTYQKNLNLNALFIHIPQLASLEDSDGKRQLNLLSHKTKLPLDLSWERLVESLAKAIQKHFSA